MRGLLTYFVFFPRKKIWKIGRTRNMGQRVSFLRSQIGKQAEIHALFPHDDFPELECHSRFEAHKIRREIFSDCSSIRLFLKRNKSLLESPIKGRKSILKFQSESPKKRESISLHFYSWEVKRMKMLARREKRALRNLIHVIVRHAIFQKKFNLSDYFLSDDILDRLLIAEKWPARLKKLRAKKSTK